MRDAAADLNIEIVLGTAYATARSTVMTVVLFVLDIVLTSCIHNNYTPRSGTPIDASQLIV